MAEIRIRGLSVETVRRLRAQAKRNGRSLPSEAKHILQNAASSAKVSEIIEKWQKKLAGRKFSQTSADLIREDRER